MSAPSPTLSLDDFRAQARILQQARKQARANYEAYRQEEAEADRDYRIVKATALAEHRAAGMTGDQAKIQAEADCAPQKLKRDLANAKAKGALLRVEELEADKAVLRSIADWSQRIDGVAA